MKTSRVPLGKGMRVAVVRNGNTDTATFEELLAMIGAKADTSALQFINGVPIDKIINANGTLNPTVIAQIYQSFLSESRKNRVPDSDIKFQSTYWTLSGLAITNGASPIGGNAFTFTGTGAASGNQSVLSDIIDVTPGETVCVSGYIDATHCTVNAPFWAIYDITGVTQYAVASGVLGKAQRVSQKWLVPAGVTQVIVVPDTNNATVANATKVVFSEPQLESGDQASSYMPNLANDGTGYLKAGAAAVDLASAIHSGKNLDNLADTATRFAAAEALADKTYNHLAGGHTNVIPEDWSQFTMANVPGSYYASGISSSALASGSLHVDTYEQSLKLGLSGSATIQLRGNASSNIPLLPNSKWIFAVRLLEDTAAAGRTLTVRLFDSTDTQIDYATISAASSSSFQTLSCLLDASASSATRGYVRLDFGGTWGSGDVVSLNYITMEQQIGSDTTPSAPVPTMSRLAITGSGLQIGDARNTRGLTAAGVQYYLSGFSITATSTTISIASGTLIMGGSGTGNTAYNSSSATGLTPSAPYYLYYLDPGFAGGSKTLNATTAKTNLAQHPDAIYLGYWTTPASGSGGSGGNGGCVYENAWLDTADGSAVQAKDATQGLMLNAMSDAVIASATPASTPAPILNAPYGVLEPCVTISTASGSLTLSDMTPVNCKAGAFPAFDVLGEEVWTSLNGGAWEKITGVVYMQPCQVMRVSLGGLSYGAGDQPGYFIFTHNTLKP